MSQANNANFEVTDVPASGSSAVAEHARRSLSDEFVSGIGAAVANAIKTGDGDSTPEQSGNVARGALKGASEAGDGVSQSIGDLLRNKIHDRSDSTSGIADAVDNIFQHKKMIDWDHKYKVSDKDRAEAKETLAKELSDLIPDADRTLLKEMQGAIIDGNLDQLKKSLGELAGNPEKMQKFLKHLNGQFEKHGWGNVELSSDSQGNVLLYERNGNTAVSINAKTGETTLRAVERQADGSVLLKPGEIINRTPADVMRNIGDEATRGVVGPRFHRYYKEDFIRPLDKLERSGSGGGGGGGGGESGSFRNLTPATPQNTRESQSDNGDAPKGKKQK